MAYRVIDFNDGWRFVCDWADVMWGDDFDDSDWAVVNLPHDWSIGHVFSPDVGGYCRAAYLPNGMGCYRKEFVIPDDLRNSRCSISFGGVYKNSEVFINGVSVVSRPWGYIDFEVDVTDYLRFDRPNIVTVKVDDSVLPGARWYSGTGIYRKVFLNFSRELDFARHSIQLVTHCISEESAYLAIRYGILNNLSKRVGFSTIHRVLDPDMCECARIEKTHVIGSNLTAYLDDGCNIPLPKLWSCDEPFLYTLESSIIYEGIEISKKTTTFGIREFVVSPEKGLYLNGKPIKINGVCLHNDGGALGAACGKRTFIRQLEILKKMGCNAVRTAHHPFSTEFLDACDELGIMVLAESFDEWQEPIRVYPYSDGEGQSLYINYYAELFDEWSERDLADMIRRDRNHPSIFSWSVGNEVPQLYKPSGYYIAERLIEIVADHDSRPVTCAAVVHRISDRNIALFPIAGFNYPQGKLLDDFHSRHPEKPVIVTEHYSAQTRREPGVYMPKDVEYDPGYTHHGAKNFIREMERIAPGTDAHFMTAERDFIIGQFIWTGFDYLGEPTPYDYPAHTSFFGVIDTCGRPKDGYYFYRSVWRDEPVVHIASHWDYADGDTTEIMIISNCDKADIILNGKHISEIHFSGNKAFVTIPFECGVLEVRAYKEELLAASDCIRTSGKAHHIEITSYFNDNLSKGEIEYLACRLCDAEGFTVRNSRDYAVFEVEGAGFLRALDNGNPLSLSPYQNNNKMEFCDGWLLAIVQSNGSGNPITLKAKLADSSFCDVSGEFCIVQNN